MDTISFLREIYTTLSDSQQKEQLAQVVDNFKFLQNENEQLRGQLEPTPLPEAPASATVKMVNSQTQMEWLFTVRGHSPASLFETLPRVEQGLIDRGYVSFDAYVDKRRAEREQSSKSLPPVASGNGQAQQLTFPAQSLVATINSGKAYWKVQGGKFTRFGITVWPEVLEAAGFFTDQLDPMQTYSLTGFTATYVTKEDGKPDKVVSLTK